MRQRRFAPQDRERTAWHEAGHVVISQVLGVRVQWTSIKPDLVNDIWHGRTMHDGVLQLLDQWEDWRDGSAVKGSPHIAHAIIAMAGYAAAPLRPRHKGQRSPRRWRGYRGSPDMRNAYRSLMEADMDYPEKPDIIRRHARLLRATKTLVRRHKSAIARMAEALLRLDELDWRQVESVAPLRRWPANRPRPSIKIERDQQRGLITLLRRRVR